MKRLITIMMIFVSVFVTGNSVKAGTINYDITAEVDIFTGDYYSFKEIKDGGSQYENRFYASVSSMPYGGGICLFSRDENTKNYTSYPLTFYAGNSSNWTGRSNSYVSTNTPSGVYYRLCGYLAPGVNTRTRALGRYTP